MTMNQTTTARTIALLSFSGNAGKTTLARNLFARHMPEAELVSIESINADGQEAVTLRGKQFAELLDALALSEDGVIVDVGASNVEDFLQRMTQTRRSHQLFDLFVVPVMPGTKQIRDCIATLNALATIGVPAEKTRVICNGLDATSMIEDSFAPLLDFIAASAAQLVRPAVSDSEVYSRLVATKGTLAETLADNTDHLAAVRSATTPEARLAASQAFSLYGLAESAAEELDQVWLALNSLPTAA